MHANAIAEERQLTTTVAAENLVRGFGSGELRSFALRGVSIELHAGQLTLMMGPSGSGKSTLLAILSGLLSPDEGTVETLGQNLWKMTDGEREAFRRKHFGFIFQGYNLFPALTAIQQLQIVLQWGNGLSHSASAKVAKDTLDKLDMSKKGHLRPMQLSGGEKQRVAVARALIKQPELLFADEPTAALDWEHGKQVVHLLSQAAHEKNATVLVVSHDPRLISLADRVLDLEDGLIVSPGHHSESALS